MLPCSSGWCKKFVGGSQDKLKSDQAIEHERGCLTRGPPDNKPRCFEHDFGLMCICKSILMTYYLSFLAFSHTTAAELSGRPKLSRCVKKIQALSNHMQSCSKGSSRSHATLTWSNEMSSRHYKWPNLPGPCIPSTWPF